MVIWQVDFCRLPQAAAWELLACTAATGEVVAREQCSQSEAGAAWLAERLATAITAAATPPDRLAAFRPQTFGLLAAAAEQLGLEIMATRRLRALKARLQTRSAELGADLLAIERLPPRPIPEALQGERWRFGAVSAGDLELAFGDRPIPIRDLPPDLLPLQLGLTSDTLVPGVAIDGGRQALALARWIQASGPVAVEALPGETPTAGGTILEAGLSDRWILATFDDPEMARAAQTFRQRQAEARGLHFLLVRPDDSGMTDSGFWLLQPG